ncbi:hypothetical protein PGB90_002002 [Kerria lacca]
MSETTSRKRASSEQEENTARKVPRNIGIANIHLKILIPSNLAGVVLGKGGETIIRIQDEANIKAHMSKGNEYFPGTSDRICTLSANDTGGIKKGLNLICDKLFEKMDSIQEKMTLKMLIPNATAGMIIGKGGEHIRAIKEKTGAYVQLSRKNELPERCITVSGTKDEIALATDDLVEMIAKDPLSGSCLQINYNNFNMDSGPQLSNINSVRPSILADYNNGEDYDPRPGDLNFSFNFTSPKTNVGSWLSPDLMDYIALLLRGGGYRSQAINEIIDAIEILIKYGVLNSNTKRTSNFNTSNFNTNAFSFDNFGNGIPSRFSRGKDDSDAYILPSSFGEDEQGRYLALQVSDNKVGAIMGTRGATLTEIQQLSKARVRVSRKDDYVDGTKDRLVYIYGSKKEVDAARSLIEWKVKEYDTKFSKR